MVFTYDDPHWSNLGQGSPETGAPAGRAPPRIENLVIPANTFAIRPLSPAKRIFAKAVADYYNRHFSGAGKASQYTTADNVSNRQRRTGSRSTRLASAPGEISTWGIFIPDYTALRRIVECVSARFTPIPDFARMPRNGYKIPLAALKKEILGRGLSAPARQQSL